MKQLISRISEENHTKLQIYCCLSKVSMNFVINTLIKQFLVDKDLEVTKLLSEKRK